MTKKSDFLSLDEARDLVTELVKETNKLLYGSTKDTERAKVMAGMFLTRYIASMALVALSERPPGKKSKADVASFVYENFRSTKHQIQDCVALGIGSVMTATYGKEVEYFCQIYPIPQPVNKEPC